MVHLKLIERLERKTVFHSGKLFKCHILTGARIQEENIPNQNVKNLTRGHNSDIELTTDTTCYLR